MASNFQEVEIPHQKQFNGIPLPYVLCPNPPLSPNPSFSHFINSIKIEKAYLESLLEKSGAILFRGFPVNTASDFNDVVEAFGYPEFNIVDGAALRTKVAGRVYTANEAPHHLNIGFHHEMSYMPEFPTKLLFFCEVEPIKGGETPIILSHIVYEKMKETYPDFVQRLEDHGIVYSKVFGDENDPSNPIGRSWRSQFDTDDKKVAEERAAKKGLKLNWLQENNGVRIDVGPAPGIKYEKSRNRKLWFNNIFGATNQKIESNNMLEESHSNGKVDPSDPIISFGDGEPMPREIYFFDSFKFLEEETVAFPWQKGDVLLIDNLAVLHARKSCIPPRRVLASFCN